MIVVTIFMIFDKQNIHNRINIRVKLKLAENNTRRCKFGE